MLVTDPPYGRAARFRDGYTWQDYTIAGDATPALRDEILEFWSPRPALVFGHWRIPRPAETRTLLTWDKGCHVGMGDLTIPWKPNTEEIYVLGSGFVGFRSSSVLAYYAIAGTVGQAAKGTRRHPTEKPLGLMRDLIGKCPPDHVIVDPFMGSGTTLRAAKDCGRFAIGIESEEQYCGIAVARLAQLSLFEATHDQHRTTAMARGLPGIS